MKLAPPPNKLQPLPQNVQPAISQNVQRNASSFDLQSVQASQASQQRSAPETAFVGPLSGSFAFWIALVAAVLIAAGAVWLWRSL